MDEPEVPERSLFIFGRDVSQIPCFRNSFLYGITGGAAVGFMSFMRTSRPQLSTHIGFGTFFSVTIIYWFSCRYTFSKKKFEYSQLQAAMKKQQAFEGTDVERKVNKIVIEEA